MGWATTTRASSPPTSRGRLGRVGLALVALASSVPLMARAYERSTVQGEPDRALFWRYRHVAVRPVYDSSRELSAAAVRAAVTRSIATWNAAADPCSDFRLEDQGAPRGRGTNLLGGAHDGENRIVFRYEDWPDEIPPGTLALTTSVYRRSTGQILDADIDLNARHYAWTDTDDPELADTDVQNTLTHELGHLLGLSHVDDPSATMFAQSAPGELSKRELGDDDRAGLCFIYPARGPSPGAPLFRSEPLTSGCRAAPGRGSVPLGVTVLALLIAAGARTRRADRGATPDERACGSRGRDAPPRGPSRGPRDWLPRGRRR